MIEAVCDKEGPLKDECDSVVDSYFPMVWKLLKSYVVSCSDELHGRPRSYMHVSGRICYLITESI